MLTTIIVFISAIIGTLLSLKHKGSLHKIISFGILMSLIIASIGSSLFITLSLIFTSLCMILSIYYAVTVKPLNINTKISMIAIVSLLLLSVIFKIQHWTGASIVQFLVIIPVIVYIFSSINKSALFSKEFSFMLFWLTLSVFMALEQINWQFFNMN